MCHGWLFMQDGNNVDLWDIRINWSRPMASQQDDISSTCCNCPVVLFHVVARIESEIKIFWHLSCTNITMNVTKVVIKILQGNAVTETVEGRLVRHFLVAVQIYRIFLNFLKPIDVCRSYERRQTGPFSLRNNVVTFSLAGKHDLFTY